MGGSRWPGLLVGVAGVVLLGACGDDGPRAGGGSVTVFAAASLNGALTGAERDLEAQHAGLDLAFSFGSSGALAAQIEQGAPADVIATADLASMQRLVDAGLVDEPRTFARNRLEILVAPGNPRGIRELADLADGDLQVVLADESVPAGRYASEALAKAGVTVRPVSKELDVKATAAKVTRGEADAAIVYATDVVAAGDRGDGVAIPAAHNVEAAYAIAVVAGARDVDAAEVVVESIVAGDGQHALRAQGFLPPP